MALASSSLVLKLAFSSSTSLAGAVTPSVSTSHHQKAAEDGPSATAKLQSCFIDFQNQKPKTKRELESLIKKIEETLEKAKKLEEKGSLSEKEKEEARKFYDELKSLSEKLKKKISCPKRKASRLNRRRKPRNSSRTHPNGRPYSMFF